VCSLNIFFLWSMPTDTGTTQHRCGDMINSSNVGYKESDMTISVPIYNTYQKLIVIGTSYIKSKTKHEIKPQ